ncbi:MAG: glycosyltransferase family 4 protein [Planctomycetota bacterium]
MKPIRVLHCLEATIGGTARHLEEAVLYLPPRGVEVTAVVSPVRDPEYPARLAALGRGGTRVHSLPMRRAIRPFCDAAAFRTLKRILREEAPDLVHTHASKAGFLGRFAARQCGIPVVHTPHVFPMEWAHGLSKGIYGALERLAARRTDRLVVLNEEQAVLAREALRIPEARLVLVPNGVDAARFAPPDAEARKCIRREMGLNESTRVVGTAGRLAPQKAVEDFLEVAWEVRAIYPYAIFLIAGSGSLEGALQARVREMKLVDTIRFLGEVKDPVRFYRALDVFVLTSLWEGMPYTILEAQASGLPVVATSTTGACALIEPGITGTLAPVKDVEALASAVCTYLSDPLLRSRIGQNARRQVLEHFTVEQWADSLCRVYRSLLAGR